MTDIFTAELQEFNSKRFAYFNGDIPVLGDIQFTEPDAEPFAEVREIFIDVIFRGDEAETRLIRAFNRGDFDAVVATIGDQDIAGKRFFLSYLFRIIQACVRSFGTEKFGTAGYSLDYYFYRMIEIAYASHDTEVVLRKICLHATSVLRFCIEKNAGAQFKTRKYIAKNVFSSTPAKLGPALMKLGISSESVFRKDSYSESYVVRVAPQKPMQTTVYQRAVLVEAFLYVVPGMGWTKEYCGVSTSHPGIVFSNHFDDRVESLGTKLKGYAYIEKSVVVNKIIKTMLVAFLLTGRRLNFEDVNVVYDDSRNPSDWHIMSLITSKFMMNVLREGDMAFIDVLDSLSRSTDEIMRSGEITKETFATFRPEYLIRVRMYRDFLGTSDIVRGMREIDDAYVDAVIARANSLIAFLAADY